MLQPYARSLRTKFAALFPSVIPVVSMLANQVGSQSAHLQAKFKPMTDFVRQTLPNGARVGNRTYSLINMLGLT